MSTYTPIESITLTSATPKVTFSSIPQNYTDIIMVGVITNSASQIYGAIQFNADNVGSSSTKYSVTSLANWQNNPSSDRQTSTYGIATWEKTVSGTDDTAVITITVNDYSNTAKYKTAMARVAGTHVNLSGNNIGVWRSYEAVNSISFDTANGNNFGIGCTFTLYGVQSGNSSAKATGGNIVTTDGSYWYHTFTSSGAFAPSQALSVDYLVVAGGGAGGTGDGDSGQGGGGAGGYRTSIGGSQLSLSANTYPVVVGAGGSTLSNGNDSVFASIVSTGGGRGGSFRNTSVGYIAPGNGGSGGGGALGTSAGGTGNTPSTSPSQGNNGGSENGQIRAGGGGGGAGAAGSNAVSTTGGAGGIGVSNSISGTAVYYAGGGGGGANVTGGAGGNGGGGAGASGNNNGTNGTAFTGGGGGGMGNTSSSANGYYGGLGGSGIVIIRYAV